MREQDSYNNNKNNNMMMMTTNSASVRRGDVIILYIFATTSRCVPGARIRAQILLLPPPSQSETTGRGGQVGGGKCVRERGREGGGGKVYGRGAQEVFLFFARVERTPAAIPSCHRHCARFVLPTCSIDDIILLSSSSSSYTFGFHRNGFVRTLSSVVGNI